VEGGSGREQGKENERVKARWNPDGWVGGQNDGWSDDKGREKVVRQFVSVRGWVSERRREEGN
jgi:hypothetical protein